MKNYDDFLVVVPVYNEAPVLSSVLGSLTKHGFNNILVVDDGSTDDSVEIARKECATVLSHPINLGLGGALKTARKWVSLYGGKFSFVATFDGDGQHEVSDLLKIVGFIDEFSPDILLGVRQFLYGKAPINRILISKLASVLIWLLCGKWFKDTQSGLRVFKKEVFTSLEFTSAGYSVSSEIILRGVERGFSIIEVTVPTRYSRYSLNKGQKVSNWYQVFSDLLHNS